jgi:hypothetical protein
MSTAKRRKSNPKMQEQKIQKHEIIKDRIESWFRYFEKNIKNHNANKSFVFASTINGDDSMIYEKNQMPQFTVNMLESYMSRIWGEYAKNTPDMSATPMNDSIGAEQVNIIEGYLRSVLTSSEYSQVMNNTLRMQMSAGYAVQEVVVKYSSPKSFEQEIEILDVKDPTEVGFDPLAEKYDKSDGDYTFRIVRKKKKELQREYPELDFDSVRCNVYGNGSIAPDNFEWNWFKGKDEIIRVYEYYEKKYEYVDIVEIQEDPNDPYSRKTMTRKEYNELIKKVDPYDFDYEAPEIKNSRKEKTFKIVRYTGCSDFIFPSQNEQQEKEDEGEVIALRLLPYVFFDNNSVDIDAKQCIRPYFYQAIDQQRLLDFAASNIVNDLDNMRPTDLFISDQALPPEGNDWHEGYKNPAKSLGTNVYMKYDSEGKENAPPFTVDRNSVSQSALAVFQMAIKTIQGILGCYDAQQGNMNEHDLSGAALNTSVIQSNYASMPCIIRGMEAVNQVSKVVVSGIPNIWVTKRTIPVTNKKGEKTHITINDPVNPNSVLANAFDIHDIGIYVKGSVNFDAQKDKAFKYITLLMKECPIFAEFINSVGMPLLLDNIDIRNITQIKEELKKFIAFKMQQTAKNKNMPNPEMLKIQNEEKEIMLKAHIADDNSRHKSEQLQLERIKIYGELMGDERDARVQLQKAQTEHERTMANLAVTQASENLKNFMAMNDHVLKVDKHFSERRDRHEDKAYEREQAEQEQSEINEQGVDNID